MDIMEKIIGIRRENKSKWERRTPITPDDVRYLKREHSIETIVQPSPIRIFEDREYESMGTQISEELNVPVILGIKEVPVGKYEVEKIYVFFSHTIKGQKHNMDKLKEMMEKNITLIDYECIEDENGNRLIAFGYHAGIAGMIETLWATGKRFESMGINTPLLHIKRAIEYPTVKELEIKAAEIGNEIRESGFPESITPFIVGISGYGRVSSGAQEVLDLFPVEEIEPDDLPSIENNPHTIYKCVFKEEHLVERKDKKPFILNDYYENPEKYRGIFNKYLPYLTVVLNAIYWEERYPRLITKDWLNRNYKKEDSKLQVIGDISCDIQGSIECTIKSNEPDEPVYVYDVKKGTVDNGVEGNGPVVMAVDILPSEIPRESSVYFSNILREFIPEILNASYPSKFDNCSLSKILKKAVILYRGKLTPKYNYMKKFVREE